MGIDKFGRPGQNRKEYFAAFWKARLGFWPGRLFSKEGAVWEEPGEKRDSGVLGVGKLPSGEFALNFQAIWNFWQSGINGVLLAWTVYYRFEVGSMFSRKLNRHFVIEDLNEGRS